MCTFHKYIVTLPLIHFSSIHLMILSFPLFQKDVIPPSRVLPPLNPSSLFPVQRGVRVHLSSSLPSILISLDSFHPSSSPSCSPNTTLLSFISPQLFLQTPSLRLHVFFISPSCTSKPLLLPPTSFSPKHLPHFSLFLPGPYFSSSSPCDAGVSPPAAWPPPPPGAADTCGSFPPRRRRTC